MGGKEGSLFLTTSLQPPLGPTGSRWERVVGGESLPPPPHTQQILRGMEAQFYSYLAPSTSCVSSPHPS